MARTQLSLRSTSASRVTLLAQGMRPLTVTAPCLSRSSASVNDMPIATAADVTAGVHGLAAHGAIGASALHKLGGAGDEGLGLLAGDAHARGGGLLARALAFLLLLEQLVGLHDDAIVLVVVAHAQGSHDPGGLGEVEEVHLSRHLALGRAQFGDEAGEVVPERLDLALLALEGDGGATLPRLQVEDALSGIADGPRREEVRLLEVEGLAHLTPKCARSPSMEFTVRAALLDRLYASALIDAVPMAMRWKRSSGVPMACATAALIGSACETATMTLPVCRATMRALAIRACISVKDSPPGKRKPLGCCCTAFHSGLAAASLRASPVHLPMSTSSSPLSMRTTMLRALAM